MKNFEAYEEKIKELNYNFAIKNDECVRCINICERCEFISNPFGSCPQNKTKWLYKEYIEPKPKVKIPLATKYFLESLNDKYEWIAKDEDGAVWCYKFKPEKYTQDNNKRWTVYGRGNIAGFRDVFKKEIFDFLSWEDEEPTNIKELLENILNRCEREKFKKDFELDLLLAVDELLYEVNVRFGGIPILREMKEREYFQDAKDDETVHGLIERYKY